MRLVASIVGLVLGGFVLATTGTTAHAQSEPAQPKQAKKQVMVTIKSGDSLSKLAQKYNSTYVRIYYANRHIPHPDIIHPGDQVRIPGNDEKLKKRGLPHAPQQNIVTTKQSAGASVAARQPQVAYQASQPSSAISAGAGVWDRLAACESGGNWSVNTGNGYYGGLQFSLSSWRGVGGSGYPHQASKAEQIRRAEILRSSGGWGHWPACSAKLGLR